VNRDPVDAISRTLLYEGYLLYPYRPSALKNQQRFNFGVLYPEGYCAGCVPGSSDRWQLRAECPLQGDADTRVSVRVRFLQLLDRQAVERDVAVDARTVGALAEHGVIAQRFAFDEHVLDGSVDVGAFEVRPGAWTLRVVVSNLTAADDARGRDDALQHALVSAHVVIAVVGGALHSLVDPPDDMRDVAAACVNDGVWPVLVGEPGAHDCLLASPIILYDYPQVATESAGDLFDATEIDEILALRILTLTDEEQAEARASDDRVRQILDRTASMPAEHWARLHGAVRGLRRVTEPTP
jgi:hypothetical protein